MPKNLRYRIVADFGYGDKTWVARNLTKQEVKDFFVKELGWETENLTLDFLKDTAHNHYIEQDNPQDQEDWDWQDS